MGQEPNKYHISDNGNVYRINEDGSFTSVGNIESIEKKSPETAETAPQSGTKPLETQTVDSDTGWWKRNHNWLWTTILILFVGWFISCLSCSYFTREHPDGYGNYYYEYEDNFVIVLEYCAIILIAYVVSWYISSSTKKVLRLLQIPVFLLALYTGIFFIAHYCEWECISLLLEFAIIPSAGWLVSVCISIFRRR